MFADIGGYIAGVLFGKHLMAPAISPKKSWEGLGGSLLFGITAAVLSVTFLLDKPAWVGVPLGLMLVITGVLGDLVESQVKRDLGIKDMGTLLPGPRRDHGPHRRDAAVGGRRLDRPDAAGLSRSSAILDVMKQELVFEAPRRALPPRHLADLDAEGRAAAVTELGLPAFRAKQLAQQYYGRLLADPQQMTDLPAAVRDTVADALFPTLLTVAKEITCDAGETRKTLWRAHDGTTFESVLMRYPNRNTVCISSQAGCGMACPFCATGQGGLTRNLSTAEILEQVRAAAVTLRDEFGGPASHGYQTSCSWAWASRWPTTRGWWPPSAASPPPRRTGSGYPPDR